MFFKYILAIITAIPIIAYALIVLLPCIGLDLIGFDTVADKIISPFYWWLSLIDNEYD